MTALSLPDDKNRQNILVVNHLFFIMEDYYTETPESVKRYHRMVQYFYDNPQEMRYVGHPDHAACVAALTRHHQENFVPSSEFIEVD